MVSVLFFFPLLAMLHLFHFLHGKCFFTFSLFYIFRVLKMEWKNIQHFCDLLIVLRSINFKSIATIANDKLRKETRLRRDGSEHEWKRNNCRCWRRYHRRRRCRYRCTGKNHQKSQFATSMESQNRHYISLRRYECDVNPIFHAWHE